jgi:hypothetical protein
VVGVRDEGQARVPTTYDLPPITSQVEASFGDSVRSADEKVALAGATF